MASFLYISLSIDNWMTSKAAMDVHKRNPLKSTTPERRITQLRGDTTRPLLLGDEKGHHHDIPLPEQPPRTLQKRPLPANPSQLSFEPKPIAEQAAKRRKTSTEHRPLAIYHKFMKLDQAGPATIASDSNRTCSLVAIKCSQVKSNDAIPPIRGLPGHNIVNLIEIFRETDGNIYMVYEQMDVSLRGVNSIAHGYWNSHEIAAICKEVLSGLSFVHKVLHYYYGQLDCGAVLLDREGHIKLGECILEERRLTDATEREDVRSLGYMMMELMEPATSFGNSRTIDLKHPEEWNDNTGIKDFLDATQTVSREELCKHRFLPRESRPAHHLKPHVFTALIAAKTDWDIISSPSPKML